MVDQPNADLPVTEQAAPDLDAILGNAITEHMPDDGGAEAQPGRSRDQHGRFSQSTPAAEASDTGATDAAKPADTTQTQEPAAGNDPAAQQLAPHPRWSEAEKAAFTVLPPEAKKFALDLQAGLEANFTRHAQGAAEFRKHVEPLVQAVQPFEQYLGGLTQGTGMTPPQMIHGLLATEYALRQGTPQEKAQKLQEIAASYGIDISAVSRGEIPQVDPLINQLREQVGTLTARLGNIDQQSQQQLQSQASNEVAAFASAKNADGTPKYPHFERFRAPIAMMLQAGQASTLDEAYQTVTAPLKDALTHELSTVQKREQTARDEALRKARGAAPVRSNGTQPGGSITKGADLDSIISDAMSAHGI